jgi:hypothetical protein
VVERHWETQNEVSFSFHHEKQNVASQKNCDFSANEWTKIQLYIAKDMSRTRYMLKVKRKVQGMPHTYGWKEHLWHHGAMDWSSHYLSMSIPISSPEVTNTSHREYHKNYVLQNEKTPESWQQFPVITKTLHFSCNTHYLCHLCYYPFISLHWCYRLGVLDRFVDKCLPLFVLWFNVCVCITTIFTSSFSVTSLKRSLVSGVYIALFMWHFLSSNWCWLFLWDQPRNCLTPFT